VDSVELSELSAAGQVDGVHEVGQAAALGACLEDAAGAAEGVAQGQALHDVLGAGLFAVDILAGAGGGARGGGVPVGAGGDEHGVDVVPRQQLVHVAVGGAVGIVVLVVHHLPGAIQVVGADVADGDELDVGLGQEAGQVVAAAVADADAAEHDPLAGGNRAVLAQGAAGNEHRRCQDGACLRRRLENPAAAHFRVCSVHAFLLLGGSDLWSVHGSETIRFENGAAARSAVGWAPPIAAGGPCPPYRKAA
jgi:hypothetical protein